jgi:pimeloyl-ACP methyl ester carboxylesterase
MKDKKTFFLILRFGMLVFLTNLGCSNLLYYPTRSLYVDMNKLKPLPEDVSFEIEKGQSIHGWYFQSKNIRPRSVVVFFHGNGQNRSAHFYSLHWLLKEGHDLAIFDYPGYGQTEGQPTPQNTVKTAMGAINYVHRLKPELPMIVYGHSLGGAIAMRAVWELRLEFLPKILVVDSSFLSYQKTARAIMAKSPWTWAFQPFSAFLFSDEWAPTHRVSDLAGTKIIVIHSKKDEIIPFSMGKEVFETASFPKEFWQKEAGGHNETFSDPEGAMLKVRLLNLLSESVRN